MPDLPLILAVALTSAGVSLMIIATWLTIERRRARRAHDDPDSLHREAAEFAARLLERLDDKAARLERLIHHADRRLTAIRTALEPSPIPAPPSSPVQIHPPAPPAPSTPPDDLDSITAEVYRLTDSGLSPPDIARRLKLETTDVDLIVALRRAETSLPAPALPVSMRVAKSARSPVPARR